MKSTSCTRSARCLEQYTRKHSLEIHGIPENLYTSTDDVVIKLGERLDVPIAKEEIEISHKLYNGKKPSEEYYS